MADFSFYNDQKMSLSGGTMIGPIIQPEPPMYPYDLTNKAYVDGVTPDATFDTKGRLALAGDLTGTADVPRVANAVISNPKLTPGAPSTLKGTSSSGIVRDLTLGAGLTVDNNSLNVNLGGTVPPAGASQFGVVKFDSATGDLSPSAINSGVGVLKPAAVSNTKLVAGAPSTLKGTSSSGIVRDLGVGAGLTVDATSLKVDFTTLPPAGASQFGVVKFDSATGDLSPSAINSGVGVLKPATVSNTKLVAGAAQTLKGTSSAGGTVSDLTCGAGLTVDATSLKVDSTTLPVITVPKGGTGVTSLTGYVVGAGTDNFTSTVSIPVADVSGAVRTVNGVAPNALGNVAVTVGLVTTGVLLARPPQPQTNGNVYVVSGDPVPDNDGRTFVSDGAAWLEITPNWAATDQRYLIKSGDTLAGTLTVPTGSKVLISDAPVGGTDAVNKGYVDLKTGDASATAKGVVALAGDLSGTADAPKIADAAVTNPKLAAGAPSTLKGTNANGVVSDLSVGTGLVVDQNSLKVDLGVLPTAGASQFGVVKFDSATGDLVESSTNSGVGVLKPGGVTNPKLAAGTPSTLKGTSSLGGTVSDLTCGAGLVVDQNSIKVDFTTLPTISVPGGGTGATTLTGYVKGAGTSNLEGVASIPVTDVNGAVRTVNGAAPNAVTGDVAVPVGLVTTGVLSQRPVAVPLNGDVYVVGGDPVPDNDGRTFVSDGVAWLEVTSNPAKTDLRYIVKSGDTLTGNLTVPAGAKILIADPPVGPTEAANKTYVDLRTGDASATAKGLVQLAGDLSGTAATPKIADAVVTNPKLAAGAASTLKGTSSAGIVSDLSVGAGLAVDQNSLTVDLGVLPKASDSQFGVVKFDSATGDLVESSANSGVGVLKPGAVTNFKLAAGTPSTLKGTNTNSVVSDLTCGAGLVVDQNSLKVDFTTLPIISVPGGGTGATSLTGYVKGAGTSNLEGVASIPVADVSGAVRTVNGAAPNAVTGDVAVPVGLVTTGTLSQRPVAVPLNGDVYVVGGDPVPDNDGRTFVSDGVAWLEVTSNPAKTDLRYIVKSGDTLTGNLTVPAGAKILIADPPVGPTEAANKSYVDLRTGDATATAKGIVQLAGDLSGTAATPKIADAAVTNPKLAAGTAQTLKGTNANSVVSDLDVGAGLMVDQNSIKVDSTTLPTISVPGGGTGATSLTGYVKGAGTSNLEGVASIPVADVSGAVRTVNGVAPNAVTGNVAVSVGLVTTGVLLARPQQPQPNGDVYVVSGDPVPDNDGRTFVSNGTAWLEITSNLASTDARYVIKSGDTLTGNLTVPTGSKVLIADPPVGGSDAANKTYVDLRTGDASATAKGLVALAGDLSGTAATPKIADAAVTNPKLAAGGAQTLKGTNANGVVSDLTCGAGLSVDQNSLKVDLGVLPTAGASQFGVVKFDSATGDLVESSTNSGVGVLKPGAVSNPKLAAGTPSTLKGTNANSVVSDLTCGAGLVVDATSIKVDSTTLPVISVPGGGTGATSLTGYVKGAGTANFTASASIPVVDVSGAVRTVNGAAPNAVTGNVAVPVSSTTTGTLATRPVQPKPLGDIYVVNGDSTSTNNGRTFISNGTAWLEVINNAAITDNRYVSKSGSTMSGNLVVPAGVRVSLVDLPTNATDATNKAYVDSMGGGGGSVPDATPSVKGKLALAGDLAGTAALPLIGPNKVGYSKMQLAAAERLLGNPTAASADVREVALGSLSFDANVLNSPFSFLNSFDPNGTAPTDRPSNQKVVYFGIDGVLWTWNLNGGYNCITPTSILTMAYLAQDQKINIGDDIQFASVQTIRQSTQGVTITESNNIFTLSYMAGLFSSVFMEMTVIIPNLTTPNTMVDIFTYNHDTHFYTGTGMTLSTDPNNSSCSTYSEILILNPGTDTNISIQVKNIIGTIPANIGDNGSGPKSERYIVFKEV